MTNKHMCDRCGETFMYCACDDNPLSKSSASPAGSVATGHGWLTRMTEDLHKYKEALNEIANSTNKTATQKQWADHLQRIAREALEQ